MKDKGHRDRIPSEELTAYERWELPLLDKNGNTVAHSREEEQDVKPLTASDLEAIRNEAWEDGRREGAENGHAEGLESGREAGHKEGLQQGLEEGREQGRQEALEQTREEVSQKLSQLESIMAELTDPIRRHEDELETALFNLSTVLARAVVYRELKTDSSQIRNVVQEAMASLPSTTDNVRIRVNPADLEWVREVANRLEAEASLIEDAAILPGGCKVETRHSLVDFTVEKRFQKAVQRMLDQQLDSDEPGDSVELDAMMGDLTDFHRDVLETRSPDEDSGESGAADPGPSSGPAPDHPRDPDVPREDGDPDEPAG
ncbi:flagellar assembly protein FliH [Marinobacter sp. JSM 1782161]|uniref:flagellar assembly protein FliH n=1 Tax=Marinobacter sp. JSM 1782161 TaxID=2685906 RepID=UPI001403E968|nr:flagellar assembly protein FliH [Marinobacter sp. JSM 1782161]